jgi:DNA helicase-2/ATP-dependent DNA helicase PcrA
VTATATRHSIDLDIFLAALRASHDGALPLDEGQQATLLHDYATPLWIVAGPGTGKTHTLVWLLLKRILVDGVAPDRIMLTTFTRKAAAELESRLILNRQLLERGGLREAAELDIFQVRIGTLHSLCSRILQDVRYEQAFRIRVLEDEMTQEFFLRRTNNSLLACDDPAFWERFGMLKWGKFAPNKPGKAAGAATFFNRMTENSVDVDAMLNAGDADFTRIGTAFQEYEADLVEQHRTDQAHLQQHFLNFLRSAEGRDWLGDGLTVLVDEYQDTNPIQEEIYFQLAGPRADLTVVGDDDQSLYRFRGATVESLIDFDHVCHAYLGRRPRPVYLHENRRSHPDIVNWVNRFITEHPDMAHATVRVRAPEKPPLISKSKITGEYPAVSAIIEPRVDVAADKVAALVRQLWDGGYVSDLSQIALLSFSSKETKWAIKAFADAFRAAEIPFINPHNQQAHIDRRFRELLGALSTLLDPEFDPDALVARLPSSVVKYISEARAAFANLVDAGEHAALRAYVDNSAQAIARARMGDSDYEYLTRAKGRRVTISGLFYRLLAEEPFARELFHERVGERFKALNLVLADYESLYSDGELRLARDEHGEVRIEPWTLYNFYAVFVEGFHDGLSDPQDDEVSIEPGMVNVMTIHQSKGLEFEVVFVLRPNNQPFEGTTHILEDELGPFVRRRAPILARRPPAERAAEDAVRLFFVAYSRAKRLLVLAGDHAEDWSRVVVRGQDGQPILDRDALERAGVHIR